jgi:hypothetical protein
MYKKMVSPERNSSNMVLALHHVLVIIKNDSRLHCNDFCPVKIKVIWYIQAYRRDYIEYYQVVWQLSNVIILLEWQNFLISMLNGLKILKISLFLRPTKAAWAPPLNLLYE